MIVVVNFEKLGHRKYFHAPIEVFVHDLRFMIKETSIRYTVVSGNQRRYPLTILQRHCFLLVLISVLPTKIAIIKTIWKFGTMTSRTEKAQLRDM